MLDFNSMKSYEMRDPIHKRIKFDEEERKIIDHPFFQRLRYISQNGFINAYVYPGATHDRFMHCIGSMNVARRLFGKCISSSQILKDELTSEEIEKLARRVRNAGLLHDIGHGPFSHSLERIFPSLKELPLHKDWWYELPERQAEHEDYSVLLIQTMAEDGVFDKEFAQDVSSLIHDGVKPGKFFQDLDKRIPTLQKVMKTLISGVADCDRMDYLLRDSYYCGVAYGHFDMDWIISSMGITKHEGRLIRTISENGVRAFEDMLLARYHMIDQVYYHKTKAGFAYYLEQALLTKEVPFEISGDPYEYADKWDLHVLQLLHEAAKDEKNYWSHHLMKRKPAKRILRLHHNKPEEVETLEGLKKMCEEHGIKHFTYEHKSKLTKEGDGADVQQNIFVAKKTLKGIQYVPVFEYSDLLQKYNEILHFTDFYVHREDVEKFEKIVKK